MILMVVGLFASCATNSKQHSNSDHNGDNRDSQYQSFQNRYSEPYWSERFDFR